MRIVSNWHPCPTCRAPVTEQEISSSGYDFPEVRTTDVIVTPPREGPQVDTEHDHQCV